MEKYKKLKELSNAELLRTEGKFLEALEIIKRIEEKKDLTPQDQLSSHVLKCALLNKLGFFEDALKLAEKTYKEADKLGNPLKLIEVSIEMAEALMFLLRYNESLEVIAKCEKLYDTITLETTIERNRIESAIALIKGYINVDNYFERDIELSLKYLKYGLALQKKLGNKHEISRFYQFIGFNYFSQGDWDLALNYYDKALALEENGFNLQLTWLFWFLGNLYNGRGELDSALNYFNQGLVLAEKLNSYKLPIAWLSISIADIHHMKGNFDQASIFMEQGLALYRQISNNDVFLGDPFLEHSLELAVSKNEIKQAKKYLLEIKEISDRTKSKKVDLLFRRCKALILKASPRFRNKIKAEEILKQILKEKNLSYNFEMVTLIHLCDLLITELRVTNELEVLEEIKPIISRLLNIGEKSNSYWILCETYLLQAKLALISLDLKEARRLLTQAQQITEKYGLILLARKISNEHDELLKKLDVWEKLKESKAPLSERMELSRLSEQMERMVRKRGVKLPKLDAEQPVLLTVISKDGKILLSNPFTADLTIDNAFFSEFLSSCNTFCDQILSESFDRVKFGQHTVLITAVDSFSICYMFQGQTYSARQKLIHFSEAVKKEPDIMKILEDANSKNIEIKVNEIASLEEAIYESFLSDPQQFQMPFKAYEGDGSFVFISYSHTDRLQVYPIIDYLNKTGINIWYDEGIPVSEDWKSSIVENLERCSAFLVFITPHIIDSEYVRKEISFALKKQKPFFSVYLKETQLPSKLEFEIGDIQFMNKYLMPETEFYKKLNRMLDPVLK